MNQSRMERKKANTKEKIFEVAVSLFQEKGYQNTTVDEIVDKADVAKGTFFNYFPTKSAILIHLNQKRVKELQEIIQKEFAEKTLTTKEKIIRMGQLMAEDNEKDVNLSKYLIVETFKNYGDLLKEESNNQYELINIFREILEAGKNTGELSKKLNSQMVAEILTSTYLYSIFLWVSDDKGHSLPHDVTAKMAFIIDHLLP